MNFAGGTVPLPSDLTCSGLSGTTQVAPPEQPAPLSRMTDRALFRLADNLAALVEAEVVASGENVSEQLVEYCELLMSQCEAELMRRAGL